MLESLPLVSVYIPTHNRSRLLQRAVLSVVEQTYRPLEVLVCDDGSSDDTRQIVSSLQAAGSERGVAIRYFRNEKPLGACVARNLGIRAAAGTFVTGLDDDDVFHPSRIEKLVSYYDSAYSGIASKIVNRQGDIDFKDIKSIPVGSGKIELVGNDRLLFQNILGSQLLMRTERLQALGGFDENFKAWQDYDTWVRAVDAFGPAQLLDLELYYSDVSEERPRLTNSVNRRIGARQFARKHRLKMTRAQLKNYRLSYKLLSEQNFSIAWLIKNFEIRSLKSWIKLCLRKLNKSRW